MLRKKVIFCDNLVDYDTLGNWDENGGDATYTSNNDYLDTWKTNSDSASNYLDLTTTFDTLYNFVFEIDFKAISQSGTQLEYIFRLMDGETHVVGADMEIGENELRVKDCVTPSTIGSAITVYSDVWYRIKVVQSYFQQTSTTGKVSAYYKDLSDPDNDWVYIGTNSNQEYGINDIQIGHPDTSDETYEYQFKNLILYELVEFP